MDNPNNAPLAENSHVQELLSVLRDNSKGASGLESLIGYVSSLEQNIQAATSELQAVRRELNTMREDQSHPLRTAMQQTARSMEGTVANAQGKLDTLKMQIINGCKAAVTAFKQAGISALDSVAKFFHIKPGLESLRNNLRRDIQKDTAAIAKIETVSTQYHLAGSHVKNIMRALQGKEPVEAVTPNGKLAKLLEAPFRSEMKSLTSAVRNVEKAISALDQLEKAAPQKAADVAEKSTAKQMEKVDEKTSVCETMKVLKVKIKQQEQQSQPKPVKVKQAGAEL